jgi:hypothetical protein
MASRLIILLLILVSLLVKSTPGKKKSIQSLSLRFVSIVTRFVRCYYETLTPYTKMSYTLLAPVLFALSLAAPTSDCESLKSIAILNGAKIFCAEKYPAASGVAIVPVAGAHKNNAKRFQQDDQRVIKVLGRMPEARQKAFCECYPAAKTEDGEHY